MRSRRYGIASTCCSRERPLPTPRCTPYPSEAACTAAPDRTSFRTIGASEEGRPLVGTRGKGDVCGGFKIRKASRCIQRPFCRVDGDAKHGGVQIVNLLQVTVPVEDTHRVAMITLLVNVMTK